jgi:hypothetical protein
MYAFGVLTTQSRRRAYNLSHDNRYLRILLARTDFGYKISSGPTEDTAVASCRQKCGTTIIIRHAPDLQGETFTGLSQHQRKFSNVANEHHFLCLLGGDLQRDRFGDGRNRG